jgi:hypothetical protein
MRFEAALMDKTRGFYPLLKTDDFGLYVVYHQLETPEKGMIRQILQ